MVFRGDESDSDFPDSFCSFLQHTVPSVDAAEMLLFLADNRNSGWSLPDILRSLQRGGASVSESDALRYLDALQQRGLVTRTPEQLVRYSAASADLDVQVRNLARLYIERPVTLFRIIYALRDTKIKTFADAFKIRR